MRTDYVLDVGLKTVGKIFPYYGVSTFLLRHAYGPRLILSLWPVQEVKDALDKEAVLRCMTACYEMHQAEKKKKMEGLSKGPDGSYLQSAKTLAAFGGSLLQGVVVSSSTGIRWEE